MRSFPLVREFHEALAYSHPFDLFPFLPILIPGMTSYLDFLILPDCFLQLKSYFGSLVGNVVSVIVADKAQTHFPLGCWETIQSSQGPFLWAGVSNTGHRLSRGTWLFQAPLLCSWLVLWAVHTIPYHTIPCHTIPSLQQPWPMYLFAPA